MKVPRSAGGTIPRAAPGNDAALEMSKDGVSDELIRIDANRFWVHRIVLLCELVVAR
jgi:hypothetical protein